MKIADSSSSYISKSDNSDGFDSSLASQNALAKKPSATPVNYSLPLNAQYTHKRNFSNETQSSTGSSWTANTAPIISSPTRESKGGLFSSKMTEEKAKQIISKEPPVKPAMANLFDKPERAKQKRWLPVTYAKVKTHEFKEQQFTRELEKYNEAREFLGKNKVPADIFNPGIPINKDWYRSEENLPLPPERAATPVLSRRQSTGSIASSVGSSLPDGLSADMRRFGI